MSVANLAFHLTDRCQLDCKHCLRDPAQKPADLPFDVFVRALDDIKRLYRCSHVALTGGEPTLYPHFVEALDALVDRDFTWHMVTNGRNFPWLIERFAERPARGTSMRAVDFSLDGADEPVHDRIRGAGSFREVMRACALADAHGHKFVLQMAVNALNQHQIEAFGLLASQLRASRASFSMLQPTGTLHDADLFLPAHAWRSAADRIDRLAEALTIQVSVPEGWPQELPFHVCEPFRSEQLHIDVEGRLNLCCQHSGIPGEQGDIAADLKTTPFVEGHGRLLEIIHGAQAAKLKELAAGAVDEWDLFPCNWCMKHFGKPHWSDAGAVGPSAARERWIGAWGEAKGQAPARARLPIIK